MPIYEYQCSGCDMISEAIQKITDPPLKKCDKCGGKITKLMSMNTFQLKGKGWFATDYKEKKESKNKRG